MTSTHYIILAQGQQTRLPGLPVAKQLLPLPGCGGTKILDRTLRQIWELECRPFVERGRDAVKGRVGGGVTVVGGSQIMAHYLRTSVKIPAGHNGPAKTDGAWYQFTPTVHKLEDPGNSSLKGIDRFLRAHDTEAEDSNQRRSDRTIVLLGDVIYSWACLRALRDVGPPWCIRYVGTSDLSKSGGELWGVSWTWEAHDAQRIALTTALNSHPPFTDYQPGQLRRWLWAMQDQINMGHVPSDKEDRPWWTSIDDYTNDVDIPEHLDKVDGWSRSAAEDDAREGVTW